MDKPELPSHEYGVDDLSSWNKKLFEYARDTIKYCEWLERKVKIYKDCLSGMVFEDTGDDCGSIDFRDWARTALNDGGD